MKNTMDNYVVIKNLSYRRGDKMIFANMNMEFKRGKITAIMGPSGCGKTTLLRLISAQLYPTSGQILVDTTDIHTLNKHNLYKIRRNIGYLFQSGALFTNLNVFENVAFTLREHTNIPEEMIRDIVLMQLEAVGLRGAWALMTSELSGGMAHRVALARSMVLNPQLMLYDEPFTGQDPITMGVLLRLIKRLNDLLSITSIIVSHDVAETASIADYIYIIADGSIVGEGTAQEIFESENPLVKQFINGVPDGIIPFHYKAIDYREDLGL